MRRRTEGRRAAEWARGIPCALALAFLLVGAAAAAQDEALDERRAALSIDGVPIPWEEFAAWQVRFQGEMQVKDFVKRRMLARALGAAGIEITRADARTVSEAWIEERVERAFGGDREQWLDEILRLGSNEGLHRATLEERALVKTWVHRLVQERRRISEEDLREAYARHYGPGGRQLALRLIHLRVVSPPAEPGMTRHDVAARARILRAQVLQEAEELRRRLIDGADFAELARERSEDPLSRHQGGRLAGGLRRVGYSRAELARIQSLELGEISEPIYGRGGWNLFLVEGVEIVPFDAVADELRRELEAAPPNAGEADALFGEIMAGVEVEILPEMFRAVEGYGSEPQTWRMEEPVLLIDGEPVTRGEYGAWITAVHGPPIARVFAESWLLERRALAEGIEIGAPEVERRLAEHVTRLVDTYFHGDRDLWRARLSIRDISEEGRMHTLAMRMRKDLIAERMMLARRDLTEDMIRREWEDRYGPGGRSPDVRWIMRVLSLPAGPEDLSAAEIEQHVAEQRALVRETLEDLRRRIADGEDFATLARLYSQDKATRERGGRPARRFEPGTWPEIVQDALRELQPGQVTPVLEMTFTYYLFELLGTVVVPYEDVRAELERDLMARQPSMVQLVSFVNSIYKEHDVRVLPGIYEPLLGADERAAR